MISILYVSLLILLGIPLFILLFKLLTRKPIPEGYKKLPGDSDWSLGGNLFLFHKPLWSYLFNKSKIYGPIFKFTMGCRETVILSSNKILSKALKEKGIHFSGRWPNISFETNAHDSNILFKDNEWWTIQRNFILKVLKNFVSGKQRSIEVVNQECLILLKDIREACGKEVNTKDLFKKSMVNIISMLVMNMRFERESKNFKILSEIIEKRTQSKNVFIKLILMFPALEKFPNFIKFLFWCSEKKKKSQIQNTFFKETIDEHKKQFMVKKNAEDLIDAFLKEQHNLEQDSAKNPAIMDWQLIRTGIELFTAAFEKTTALFLWSMVMMARHPEIQDKIHQEIIELIGPDKMPNLINKISLPYTQAVIDEILRFSSVVPLALPHRLVETIELEGYFMPKDLIVFSNLYACHRDKDIWEKPFEFYPEHFLKTLSNGEIKYTPRDDLVPFSIGVRHCLGEALTRMEFFVFLISIIQKFKVKFDKGMTEEKFNKIIQGTDGMIRSPLKADVVFEIR